MWGDGFHKNIQIKKNSFYFLTFIFLIILLLHKTLKGSRNIQGSALVRAVMFKLKIFEKINVFLRFLEKIKGFLRFQIQKFYCLSLFFDLM